MVKKKVLLIYSVMNVGGAETFIMNVYRNINRKNIQFDFLCTSKSDGFYDKEILELGGRILHYNAFVKRKIIKIISNTIRIIRENGPYDAIYLPIQFYSSVFCIIAKLAGIKMIIVHSHSVGDNNPKQITRRIYESFCRLLINILATNRIACGKKAGEALFGKKRHFDIMYNGIDLNRFVKISDEEIRWLKKKYGIKQELIIGHVGRFSKVKNHDFFIPIAQELVKRNIAFKIVLVGDGELFDEFKESVRKNSLNDYFIFTGLQRDTPLFYSMFDVLVMPSLYEGFPVSIIEAIASGVPCVLSNQITREVDIIKGECIFIKLNESIKKWCDEIISMSKKEYNSSMNCKKLHLYGFSIKQVSNQFYNIIVKEE